MTSTLFSRSVRIGFLLVSIATAVPSVFGQSPNILGGAKERQPSYGELENFTILSYTDLDGWDQAAEFRVSKDGKHAYISNYQGFSIVDVSDPAKPRVISQVKNDPSVQSQYIDVLGNILVINQDGVRDEKIQNLGWRHSPLRYHRSGKAARSGFLQNRRRAAARRSWILAPRRSKARKICIHRDHKGRLLRQHSDDRRHQRSGQSERGLALVVSRTMDRRAEKKPGENWVEPDGGLREGLPKIWVALHDITTYKDRAYLAYRDQGVIILDISDVRKPTMISQIKWSPPEEGNTHSVGIVDSGPRRQARYDRRGRRMISARTLSVRLHACPRRSQREESGSNFDFPASAEPLLPSRSARAGALAFTMSNE